MDIDYILLIPALLPFAAALTMNAKPLKSTGPRRFFLVPVLVLELIFTAVSAFAARGTVTLFALDESLSVSFRIDGLGRIFSLLVAVMWLLSGLFSQEYMANEENTGRYYIFLLLSQGALMLLTYAANYLTMYLGFEFMTLLSAPLALHTQTEAARHGGFKYLFYSVFGACLGLFGFFVLHTYGLSTVFTPGGVLDPARTVGHEGLITAAAFLSVIGFGAKAGMFPLHAWLPAAHPEAPAGASALLSGVITKAGVLSVIRVVYYQFGADFLRGTWAQYTWLALTLTTVFLGSMLAYKEKLFKKRLAYSTVSQVSYILFGLALLEPTAFTGAVLHVVVHSAIKNCLFFTAGAVILKTGKKDVRELRGIGKEMPVTVWCFTLCSLGLVGIPPLGGFVSKWYLAQGSVASGIPVFSWLGPVTLLVSALLTAGYLFPITVSAFLPGSDFDYSALQRREPTRWITVPLLILTALTLITGLFPGIITSVASTVAGTLC